MGCRKGRGCCVKEKKDVLDGGDIWEDIGTDRVDHLK